MFRFPKKEHLFSALKSEIIIFISGIIFFFFPPYGQIAGILLFGVGIYQQSLIIETLDKRESVIKAEKSIKTIFENLNIKEGRISETAIEVSKTKDEILKTKKEIEDIKDKTFDVFSKRGFKSIEERLKEIEEAVGISDFGYQKKLSQRVEKLEEHVKKITGKSFL